jgi:hypothetical protein
MSVQSRDALEQSQRLLDQMESAQADYEAHLQESKQALARSDRLLARLRDLFSRHNRSPRSATSVRVR